MPSRRLARRKAHSPRAAQRAALLVCCGLFLQGALAQALHSIEEIGALGARDRENALAVIRNSPGGEPRRWSLEPGASRHGEARGDGGEPPSFPGCMRADEFELQAQLALAR